MRIGDVLRYGLPKDPSPALVDGLANFWHTTNSPGCTRAQLEKGINPIKAVPTHAGSRVPAVLLSSSPHKVGSEMTPWQDHFDAGTGYARYFGDSKASSVGAPNSQGNRAMLEVFRVHSSPTEEVRLTAAPLILFRRVTRDGAVKGFVEFQGVAIIERVKLVTQVDPTSRRPFTNYAFDLVILSLAAEGEDFDWDWISTRRLASVADADCHAKAPASWRQWVKVGQPAIPNIRRSVAKLSIVSRAEQLPIPGSREATTLEQILNFYEGRKHRFEALAELVAAQVIEDAGASYRLGWISRRGHDFGIDFIARLDIGNGFAGTQLVVLGQAKCERNVTSAKDIARTVARLQRGWIGCYVTTSFFSPSVQQEVLEDKFPIVLIHGGRVAEEVRKLVFETGATDVEELLRDIDQRYESRLAQRRPEEILLD